eukprot:TRINITY_DN7073_c0_g1_i1.p1 TRINITY_DN7073_c0_g1~~TRINITY_DN7073_c0_g1_i1.p1  ORF type:complete len:200 (-),score=48.57 TRINITY_DN7073_c0_g1_i1:55-654(-)
MSNSRPVLKDFEKRIRAPEIQRDPLKILFDIPSTCISAENAGRVLRTSVPVVPNEPKQELPEHVKQCLDVYNNDWVVIQKSHDKLGRGIFKDPDFVRSELRQIKLPPQQFDCNMSLSSSSSSNSSTGSTSSTSTPLSQNFLTLSSSSAASKPDPSKIKERYSLFKIASDTKNFISDPRSSPLPPDHIFNPSNFRENRRA